MQLKKLESEDFLVFLVLAAQLVINLFLLLFSSTFILTYFEPVRHYVGVLGILLFSHALLQKLLLRHAVLSEQSFNGEVPAGSKKM